MAFEIETEAVGKTTGGTRRGLLQIASQVSASIGTEFLESLVKNLAEGLAADCVYMGEFAGGQFERLKGLAICADSKPGGKSDYILAGTLAAQVATGEPSVYTRGVQKRFPHDPLLLQYGAQAAVAVPLMDSSRQPLGVLMALFRQSLTNARLAKATLEIFAPRAAAELQRKQADDALRESEQRYRVFIAQNPDAMWRIEFETPIATNLPEDEQIEKIYRYGYLAECNQSLAILFGLERAEQLVGSTFEVLAKRADPRLREHLSSAIRSGYRFSSVETEPVDPSGNRRSLLRTHWGIVEDGKLYRIWGTHRDLTELRRAETAAQVSEGRLAELLEGAHLVTFMLDSDGSIMFCNENLLNLTGWQPDDVANKNWLQLMVPQQDRERVRVELAATQINAPAPHYFESALAGKDGQRRLIGWKTTVLRDADGRVSGVAGVGRDLTAYKAMESGLQRTQKLDSIGRSVGRIAQDFGVLLANIIGHCAALIQSKQDQDPAAIREIKTEAEHGAALAQQLLAFSRRQILHPELLNLNTVVGVCGRTLEGVLPANVTLTTDLDPSLASVRVDAAQINQAILNLALNARDAMPGGGKLTISSANVELDANRPVHLSAVPPGEYVRLSIADTGVGINGDGQAHLFEPFYTTKEHRSGLGLSTVYGIVQQSGGHLAVQSEPEAGATFQIYLPRVRARP